MKIIKIKINNFGKFSNFEYYFNNTLTSITQDNGYGKTTLVNFIAAMFYSLDNNKANSKFNDRLHYYPFQGGTYGGSIDFIYNDINYKIVRYFDKSSQLKDELKVYKNENLDSDLSQLNSDLGQYFFGINKESFFKLLFITSDEIKIASNDSIVAKLSNVLIGYENVNSDSISKAKELLEEYKKEYKPNKKSLSNPGKINSLKDEISNLQQEIDEIEVVKSNLTTLYEDNKKYDEKILDLQEKLKIREDLKKLQNLKKQHQDLLNKQKQYEDDILNIKKKYPNDLPLKEDISKLKKCLNENKALKNHLLTLDESYIKKYDELKKDIKNISLINDDTINQIDNAKNEIEKLEDKKQFIKNRINEIFANDKEIINRFDGHENEVDDDLNKLNNKKSSNKKSSLIFYGFIILCLIGIISGGVLTIFNLIAGVIIISISAIIAITLFVVKKIIFKNNTAKIQQEILSKYHYENNKNILDIINQIHNDYSNYKKIKESIKKEQNELDIINNSINNFYNQIVALLSLIFYQEFNIDNYNKLIDNLKVFKYINDKKIEFDKNNKNTLETIKNNEDTIKEITNKYHINIEDISFIENDIELTNEKQTLLNSVKEEIKQFVLKNDLDKITNNFSNEQLDLLNDETIQEEIKQISSKKGQIETKIKNDEEKVDTLGGLKHDLENKKELLKKYNHDYDLITISVEILKSANNTIIDKYLKPIKDNFNKYAKLLEESLSSKINMNSNLEISIEMSNDYRSDDYLSTGNKAIVALCYRLALIETMYKDSDKPFVLLDDPGVQLDDNHIKKMIQLIKNISSDMQIIYLTCHDSRKID